MLRRGLQQVYAKNTMFKPASYNMFAARLYAADAKSTFLDRQVVLERVITAVKKHEKADPNKVAASAHLINDLGMDSLDATEVVMEVENEFSIEIPDEEAFKLLSIEDIVNYVSASPMAK